MNLYPFPQLPGCDHSSSEDETQAQRLAIAGNPDGFLFQVIHAPQAV